MLDKIKSLFSNFESSKDHSKKIKNFKDALETINNFLATNPSNNEIQIVNNLKHSYTRKLLEQLSPESDLSYPIDEFYEYLQILLFECEHEVKKLVSEDPKLNANFDYFKKSVYDDLKTMIRILENY